MKEEIRKLDFSDYDPNNDEIYHRGYVQEFMDKCNELELENIESYTCHHSYGCDCPVGEDDPDYFCLYCGDHKKKSELSK